MASSMVVQIRNYQRLKKANFVFEPGLNVIVGPSNNGKSSTLRAITTALFNLSKDSHVTIGETMSVVGIRYKGHEVIWKRDLNSASKNSYKIDGKTFTKFGKGQPKEVADALGIFEVDLDDTKERLNFQKQMAYPFLLDRTPSQVFKFMAQSAEEDNLMSIIDQMKTDQNSISATIKANQASMDSIKVAYVREKAAYDKVKGKYKVCKMVIDLDPIVKKFTELEKGIQAVDESTRVCRDAEKVLNSVNEVLPKVESALAEVKPLWEEFHEIGILYTDLIGRSDTMRNFKAECERCESQLKAFEGFPSSEVFAEMGNIWALYSQAVGFNSDRANYHQQMVGLQGGIEFNTSECERLLKIIKEAEELDEVIGVLDSMIMWSDEYQKQMDNCQKTVSDIQAELVSVEKELAEFDVCPYCGSNLKEGNHGEH